MTLTHRRHHPSLKDGFVILFAETGCSFGNDHYGPHVWTLQTKLPNAAENEELIAFAQEFYSVDRDEAVDLVNPEAIVDTAKAWDDAEFVSALWQRMECGYITEHPGFRTNDGAAVINRFGVELTYAEEISA